MKELQQLFIISTGYTFRDAIAEMSVGKVGIIQAGDINAGKLAAIPRVQFANQKHLLQAGDIVVSARGSVAARTITPDILPAIASSSVFVLHPISQDINSRFVALYLNSIKGQEALRQITSGAYIKILRKPDLANLHIPQPPSSTQETVISLHETIERQREILKLKEQLLENIDNTIINQLKGEK